MKRPLLACASCIALALSAQIPGTGRIKVTLIRSYSSTEILSKPPSIVVYNFATSEDEVNLNRGLLNRVRTRVSGNQDDQKAKLAHEVAEKFSDTLMKNLRKLGIPVIKGLGGDPAPDNSLAVQGDFLLIDDGNRARRMAIGLGAGASKVETHVQCYVKQPEQNVILTEFTAQAQSSRKPGAAETMGVGAAPEVAGAASGVTEMKQGAEGDADRLAKAITKQIMKAMQSQGWVGGSK